MIRKDHSHPTGRYINQEDSSEPDDVGTSGIERALLLWENQKIRTSLLFCLLERFLFVLFFVGKACLVGLSLFLLLYFLILEIWLPSSAFFRKYFKTNCFISMCRTEFRTASNRFYWHSLEKNLDESSRMWKNWNFKVLYTECRKISEVVSLSKEIYCVRICKRKICSRT